MKVLMCSMNALGAQLCCIIPKEGPDYRTRAIIGRSRLVAAPLRNQAKRHFL